MGYLATMLRKQADATGLVNTGDASRAARENPAPTGLAGIGAHLNPFYNSFNAEVNDPHTGKTTKVDAGKLQNWTRQTVGKDSIASKSTLNEYGNNMRGATAAGGKALESQTPSQQQNLDIAGAKQVMSDAGTGYMDKKIHAQGDWSGAGAPEYARNQDRAQRMVDGMPAEVRQGYVGNANGPDISKLDPHLQGVLKSEGRKDMPWYKQVAAPFASNQTVNTAISQKMGDQFVDKTVGMGDKTQAAVTQGRWDAVNKYGPWALGGLGLMGMLSMMGNRQGGSAAAGNADLQNVGKPAIGVNPVTGKAIYDNSWANSSNWGNYGRQ